MTKDDRVESIEFEAYGNYDTDDLNVSFDTINATSHAIDALFGATDDFLDTKGILSSKTNVISSLD